MTVERKAITGVGELFDGDNEVAAVCYSLLVAEGAGHGVGYELRDGELAVERWRRDEVDGVLRNNHWYTLVLEDGQRYLITLFLPSPQSVTYHVIDWQPAT